ncbi:gamma-aminobutyric acid type b receptor subunit 1 [Anaeramoeba flamelloides]|uniref:Gamma-aminobutyric acid type b receptor subunit 1 n=1 Tax=Anaeramoeba flamelloides TaxID=1746091 RepID=A0ABQ8XD52_9EUKA|nr:gamma-aminobutyric acid type b receptor subunit 1 [Anaeramoeba flamelloides]
MREAPKFTFIKSYDWIWKCWKQSRIWWSIPQYLFIALFCLLLILINSNNVQIISLFGASFIFIVSILIFRPYYTSIGIRFSHNELYSIVMILIPNVVLSLFISKYNYLFFSFLLVAAFLIFAFAIKLHRNYVVNNVSNLKTPNLELNDIQDYKKIDEQDSDDNIENNNSESLIENKNENESLYSSANEVSEENENFNKNEILQDNEILQEKGENENRNDENDN